MSSDNRGLASADEEAKERVAKAGGEARTQDKEGLSEAGRKGGETVSQDKSICQRVAREADKSKIKRRATETKFLKAIIASYVFFF